MTILTEGRLSFEFPSTANVTLYDRWSFYINQFQSVCGGAKAVDIINVEAKATWLIEIKDYRVNKREKNCELVDEVAIKVRDTLAALVAAQCNATEPSEKNFAEAALASEKLHVVLHLEQPQKPSKLFPVVETHSKLEMKLEQRLKAIDAHPKVVNQHSLHSKMNWLVTEHKNNINI